MRQLSLTPSITVTIGRHTPPVFRLRHHRARRTRLAVDDDAPRVDVLGRRRLRGRSHRARRTPRTNAGATRPRRRDGTRLAPRQVSRRITTSSLPADPVLVSLNTLQHWLWQRLQAPSASEVHA